MREWCGIAFASFFTRKEGNGIFGAFRHTDPAALAGVIFDVVRLFHSAIDRLKRTRFGAKRTANAATRIYAREVTTRNIPM